MSVKYKAAWFYELPIYAFSILTKNKINCRMHGPYLYFRQYSSYTEFIYEVKIYKNSIYKDI